MVTLLPGCDSDVPDFTFVATAADQSGNNKEIYLGIYHPEETTIEPLTQTAEWELSPTISPGEQWILYKIGGTRLENRLYLWNLSEDAIVELARGGSCCPALLVQTVIVYFCFRLMASSRDSWLKRLRR